MCAPAPCVTIPYEPCPPAPSPEPRERIRALYDGQTERDVPLSAFLAKAWDADLVVFGELHNHPVGAMYERFVLESLSTGQRRVALALEFFERDQQPALDAYLAGTKEKAAFLKETRRSKGYEETHGPLVDWAKDHDQAVVAANAPRRLVSGYRKSGKESYEDYLASLTEEERAWLPAETSVIEDAYWKRFETLMGPKMAKSFFQSQALWDDAMAESMARYRDANPEHRVFFVVGAFHVTGGLGTITKYLQRRPDDRVVVLTMSTGEDTGLAFEDADRGTGDVVLKVRPQKRERPRGPNPHARPPQKPKAPKAPKEMPAPGLP